MTRVFMLVIALAVFGFAMMGCKEDNTISSSVPTPDQSENNDSVPQTPSEPPEDNEDTSPGSDAEPDEICFANNFAGEKFRVVSYQDKIIEADREPINCRL